MEVQIFHYFARPNMVRCPWYGQMPHVQDGQSDLRPPESCLKSSRVRIPCSWPETCDVART